MASLKDTYDEAEDILDEVEYETAAKKVKGDRQQGNSGAHYLSTFNETFSRVLWQGGKEVEFIVL